jgi:hypothetical protein
MNEYWENDFNGTKPNPGTDGSTTKRFINDKYIKKNWIDRNAKNPVILYQSGKYGKKKKGKKSKKKKARVETESDSESEEEAVKPKRWTKKTKKTKVTKEDSPALIDFEYHFESKDDGFEEFIDAGATNMNDDFTEFTSGSTTAASPSPATDLFSMDAPPAATLSPWGFNVPSATPPPASP